MISSPLFYDQIRFEYNSAQNYKNINLSHLKTILDTNNSILESEAVYQLINDTSMDDLDFLSNEFNIVEAAGGLVLNNNEELLCIHRLGKWDLPKGKIESGETRTESAVREVEEETHISNLTLDQELPTTYHFYFHKEQWILKPTYWYRMSTQDSDTIPQTEEGITQVKWMNIQQLNSEFLPNTYKSLEWLLLNTLI